MNRHPKGMWPQLGFACDPLCTGAEPFFFPGAQHLHAWRSCQEFLSSLCPSLLNQSKSKTPPELPGLGGSLQMVWAQLSFPRVPEQGQRQLGPKLSLKHRGGLSLQGYSSKQWLLQLTTLWKRHPLT